MKSWRGKLATAALLVFGLLCQSENNASASYQPPVNVQLNDKLVNIPDAKPYLDSNSRVEVPLRFLSESMGYKVDWKPVGNQVKVTLSKGSKTVILQTGLNKFTVNGLTKTMDTKPSLKQSRTFVPIRFVAESLGSKVSWDGRTVTALVVTDGRSYKPVAKAYVSKASLIVNDAKNYLGVPHVRGGSTPSGFDCSGLVSYVFNKQGVSLPRTSSQMYGVGQPVSKSNLKVGDLVFFSTNGSGIVNHVGIYTGGSQFISATSSKGVKMNDINDPYYWGARYLGAKHVL